VFDCSAQFNLAYVKKMLFQRRKSIVRLLTIFENRIELYNQFNNDYYELKYNVQDIIFSNEYNIEVTMVIINRSHFFNSTERTCDLMSALMCYCRYFAIDKVRIVRPLKKSDNTGQPLDNTGQPLEKRIYFEIYSKTFN
jgi:hypothetical protein